MLIYKVSKPLLTDFEPNAVIPWARMQDANRAPQSGWPFFRLYVLSNMPIISVSLFIYLFHFNDACMYLTVNYEELINV